MKSDTQKLAVLLAAAAFLGIVSCKKDPVQSSLKTIYGAVTPLTGGTVRSFVVLDGSGNPTTVGIKFSASVLTTLPIDSTMAWMYPISLPASVTVPGFDHLEADWNPAGHPPKAIYGFPHFDFHFYKVTTAQQAGVVPGPDTVSVPKKYVPQDYVSGVIAIPDMGVHWSDSLAAEFHGHHFTDTFVYGFYHGQMTFLEPMITSAFLLSKSDMKATIKQPVAFRQSGYYPTVSHVSFDADSNLYTVALEGLRMVAAN